MLITPERKVPQRSDTSQNDHKSKGYPSKTLCKSRIEAPTGALGIRLFIRLFKIRLNSPSGGMGVCEGSSVREGLRANSSVRISSCVTSYWLNSLWHLHQLYLACSKLWWYGWRTAHCVNTVVKVEGSWWGKAIGCWNGAPVIFTC